MRRCLLRRVAQFLPVVLILAAPSVAQVGARVFGSVAFWADDWTDIVRAASGLWLRANGTIIVSGANLQVPALPPGTAYVDVASGGWGFALALRSDGQVVAFGNNSHGQCNVPPLPPGVIYVEVAAGMMHSVARRSDGQVVAFGDNAFGQCNVPPLPPGVVYVEIAAGVARSSGAGSWFSHTLALRSDGQLVAFGSNLVGQCTVPALPPGVTWTEIAAADGWTELIGWPSYPVNTGGYSLGRRSDGGLTAWGNTTFSINPPPGMTWTAIAAGPTHLLRLRSDGQIEASGSNVSGETTVPALPVGLVYTGIAAGVESSIGIRSDGRAVAFGNITAAGPPAIPPGTSVSDLALGGSGLGFLIASDGTAISFGFPYWQPSGLPPLPPGIVWRQIATDSGNSVGLRSDGSVVAWGNCTLGSCNIPPLPPGVVYVEVATGGGTTYARRSDGNVIAVGQNYAGQCNVPPLPPGTTWRQIDAGISHVALLRSDGQVVALGENFNGQTNVPPPPPGSSYVEVACGQAYTLARRDDGSVVAVGANFAGQCNVPALPPGTTWVGMSGGYDQTVLLRSDGVAVAFGGNTYGQATVPDLGGLGVVAVRASAYLSGLRVGAAGTFQTFASGCAGILPAARLVPVDVPRLGRPFELTVTDLPAGIAFVALGFAPIAPVPLGAFGMPGCTQYVALDAVLGVFSGGNRARVRFDVPDDRGLLGITFRAQALVADAGANAFGAVVSDAGSATVGER